MANASLRRSTVPIPQESITRKGGLRSKTPSVNELSKTLKNTPKGKRRLEFVEQPLKGTNFYLDLKGYKKVSSLAARIQELGGRVEEFLSKDLHYLITNRKDTDTRLSSNSAPSPTPFPANKSSSIKGAWPSPFSGDSPQSVDPELTSKHETRGKTIMKQAKATLKSKQGTCNILTNAQTWGVCVIHLEKALEKLADYGPRRVDNQPSIKELMGNGQKQLMVKIRKLQAPFIKIEDQSHFYRPLVKEFKQWPFPDLESPVGTCPFDTPRKIKYQETKKRSKEKSKEVKKLQTKQGYCECCCLHYEALDVHLMSDQHQSFARNDNNYKSLDRLIVQGHSLSAFLEKTKHKYSETSSYKAQDPYRTPTKVANASNKLDVDSQDSLVKKMTVELEHYKMSKQTKETAFKQAYANDTRVQTKRVTRSSSSPRSLAIEKESDKKILAKEKYHESQRDPFSSPETKRATRSSSLHHSLAIEKGNDKKILAKEKYHESNRDPLSSPERKKSQVETTEEDINDDSAVPSKLFTTLRPSKSAVYDEIKQQRNERVLRSKKTTTIISSDSTETISDHDVITQREIRTKGRNVLNAYSCSSSKCVPATSPSPKTNTQTADEITSSLSESQSSPKSEPSVNKRANTNQSLNGTKKRLFLTETAGNTSTPKLGNSSKLLRKHRKPKNKIEKCTESKNKVVHGEQPLLDITTDPTFESVKSIDQHYGLGLVEQESCLKLDQTYTSLFDSDSDDEEFVGFDIPQFECMSSEHELSYKIKEIVNYFTSSQDSTLVDESGHEDNTKTRSKKKRSPHGIRIILSSKANSEDDDDVFEDDDDDDDDDDELSIVADSTDGNEDEHLDSSPLRMDSIYNKRKVDIGNQIPPKRRRTVGCEGFDEKQLFKETFVDGVSHKDHTATRKLMAKRLSEGHNKPTPKQESETVVRLKRFETNEWKIIEQDNNPPYKSGTLNALCPLESNESGTSQPFRRQRPFSLNAIQTAHGTELLQPNVLTSIEERVKMRRIVKTPNKPSPRKTEEAKSKESSKISPNTNGSRITNQLSSTPRRQKNGSSSKTSSPSWIFAPEKVTSTPHSLRNTRSKSARNQRKKTLNSRKLHSTACLLTSDDAYAFK